jgi:hypothetical protein
MAVLKRQLDIEESEIRQLFQFDGFGDSEAVEHQTRLFVATQPHQPTIRLNPLAA